MKKNVKTLFAGILMCVLFLSSLTGVYANSETTNEEAYLKNYQSTLQVMKQAMTQAPRTGDPTLNFLYEMIPHHEAGLSIAENELDFGSNPEVKEIASNIVKNQAPQIKAMSELLEKLKKNPKVNKAKEAEYLKTQQQIYNQMIARMDAVQSVVNVDKAFLEGMIPHHEAAIQMGNNILKYTKNKEVKDIVQQMITVQQAELEKMKKLLQSMPS